MLGEDPISTRKPNTRGVDTFCKADSNLSFPDNRFDLHPIPIPETQLLSPLFIHPNPDQILAMTQGHENRLVRRHGMSVNGLFSMEQPEGMRVFRVRRHERFLPTRNRWKSKLLQSLAINFYLSRRCL